MADYATTDLSNPAAVDADKAEFDFCDLLPGELFSCTKAEFDSLDRFNVWTVEDV
jgi:hypothetical protein